MTCSLAYSCTGFLYIVKSYFVKRENKSKGLTALTSDDFTTAESNTYPVVTTTWQSAV